MDIIGEKLKAARLRKGLTQKALAAALTAEIRKEAGGDPAVRTFSSDAVGNWENARNGIDPEALPALAEVLGVPVYDLTGNGTEEKYAEKVRKITEEAERERLRAAGFAPGFFAFLESEYGCGVEALGAWIEPTSGRFGVSPSAEEFVEFRGPFDLKADAACGVSLVHKVREDTAFPYNTADFDEFDDEGNEIAAADPPERIRAAVFHFAGRREDFALPLSDLLELQNTLGRFLRSSIDERAGR